MAKSTPATVFETHLDIIVFQSPDGKNKATDTRKKVSDKRFDLLKTDKLISEAQKDRNEARFDVPEVDLEDHMRDAANKRQFAPLYAQSCYDAMYRKSKPVIPATDQFWALEDRVSEFDRVNLTVVINELVKVKGYKEGVYYTAINLVDRFILSVSRRGIQPPCLMSLAVAAPRRKDFRTPVPLIRKDCEVDQRPLER